MTRYCPNCGAEIMGTANFCAYCGSRLSESATALSLMNKAVSVSAKEDNYNVVLISNGTCDKTTTGDVLEDIFGYTDAESTKLVSMAPVVVGENLTAEEAATVAQVLTEYGIQVSVTDDSDQYVDLSSKATASLFDNSGNLLAGAAAIIGALTVANRIKSYRRYKKPSLLERLFHLGFNRKPPVYHRNFRRPIHEPVPAPVRRTIRKPAPESVWHHSNFDGQRQMPARNNPQGRGHDSRRGGRGR